MMASNKLLNMNRAQESPTVNHISVEIHFGPLRTKCTQDNFIHWEVKRHLVLWLWVTEKLKVPSMCYFIFFLKKHHVQPSSMLSTQGGSPWVQLRACHIIQDNAILLQCLLYTARQIKLQMYFSIPHFLVSHATNSLYVWTLKENTVRSWYTIDRHCVLHIEPNFKELRSF